MKIPTPPKPLPAWRRDQARTTIESTLWHMRLAIEALDWLAGV